MARRSIFLTALVALALLCPAQVSRSGKGYLFRMKWAAGDAYSYSITVSMAQMKDPVPAGQFTMKVLNVANGVANVNYSGTMMMQPPINATVKMDSRGAVDQDAKLRQLGGPRLPEKALAVGEKWSVTQSQVVQGNTLKVVSTYTFKGLKALGKVNCAVVSVATSTSGAVATTSNGTMYLEVSNGQLYHLDLDTVVGGAAANGQKISTHTVIARK